jgi:hypothetical protein
MERLRPFVKEDVEVNEAFRMLETLQPYMQSNIVRCYEYDGTRNIKMKDCVPNQISHSLYLLHPNSDDSFFYIIKEDLGLTTKSSVTMNDVGPLRNPPEIGDLGSTNFTSFL